MYDYRPSVFSAAVLDQRLHTPAGEVFAAVVDCRGEGEDAGGDVAVGTRLKQQQIH